MKSKSRFTFITWDSRSCLFDLEYSDLPLHSLTETLWARLKNGCIAWVS